MLLQSAVLSNKCSVLACCCTNLPLKIGGVSHTTYVVCETLCSSVVVVAAVLNDTRPGYAFARKIFPADIGFASNDAKRLCMPA